MNRSMTLAHELPIDQPEPGLLGLAERGLLPDVLVRAGIRRLCAARVAVETDASQETIANAFQGEIDGLCDSPIAMETDAANRQHYELPAEFFRRCLGPRLKYSACYFARGNETLAEAEEAMLALYTERAELANGQEILELGCGWGSLTLWMGEHYPNSHITAVSNSRSQREFILARCRERSLDNIHVITCDVNQLQLPRNRFDRCVSIEMFEHMRNYEVLLGRIAGWLLPGGKLFVHIFCHRVLMYPFAIDGEDNWLGRHFFTGGLMPAADTLLWFQRHLAIERRWLIDGSHYARTAKHWLQNQDARKAELVPVLETVYGKAASLWFQRWRMFWMACAELFGYAGGREWLVAHYRFVRQE